MILSSKIAWIEMNMSDAEIEKSRHDHHDNIWPTPLHQPPQPRNYRNACLIKVDHPRQNQSVASDRLQEENMLYSMRDAGTVRAQ